MARKKKVYHRRYFTKRRRRSAPKLPIEVAVGLIGIPFTPLAGTSILACAQAGNWEGVANLLRLGFIGMMPDGKFDLGDCLSLTGESARFTKILLIAGLASKIRKRLVKIPMKKIPILGQYVS